MVNVIVNEKYDNKKIVNFILSEFPNLSYSHLQKSLRKKDILEYSVIALRSMYIPFGGTNRIG